MTKENMSCDKLHAERLAKLKESVLGSDISNELELKAKDNQRLDEIRRKMVEVVPGTTNVWVDYNFKLCGPILGILRFIATYPKKRKELLEVTGLTQDHIDLYFKVCGNMPYIKKLESGMVLVPGRPMQVQSAKELLKIVAYELGVILEEADFYDFTKERWDTLYKEAYAKLLETIDHNQNYGETVPEEYDE